jgi:hypothetical protein
MEDWDCSWVWENDCDVEWGCDVGGEADDSDCMVFLRETLGRRDLRSVFAGEGEADRFRGSAGEWIVVKVVGVKRAVWRGIGEAGLEGDGGVVDFSVGGRVEVLVGGRVESTVGGRVGGALSMGL